MSNEDEKDDMNGTHKPQPARDTASEQDTPPEPQGEAGKDTGPEAPAEPAGPSDTARADGAAPPGGPGEAAAADPLAAAEARIAELEAALAEAADARLRAVAEAENVRKRADRQVADAGKYAAAALARDVLGVSDNLRRAGEAVSEQAAGEHALLRQLLDGVLMVERELQAALARHGVKEVSPQPGDRFDHNFHQAMFEMETDAHPPGTVAQVVQAGYLLHDRLLRAAMVGVAKAPAAASTGGADDEPPALDEDDNIDGG